MLTIFIRKDGIICLNSFYIQLFRQIFMNCPNPDTGTTLLLFNIVYAETYVQWNKDLTIQQVREQLWGSN